MKTLSSPTLRRESYFTQGIQYIPEFGVKSHIIIKTNKPLQMSSFKKLTSPSPTLNSPVSQSWYRKQFPRNLPYTVLTNLQLLKPPYTRIVFETLGFTPFWSSPTFLMNDTCLQYTVHTWEKGNCNIFIGLYVIYYYMDKLLTFGACAVDADSCT